MKLTKKLGTTVIIISLVSNFLFQPLGLAQGVADEGNKLDLSKENQSFSLYEEKSRNPDLEENSTAEMEISGEQNEGEKNNNQTDKRNLTTGEVDEKEAQNFEGSNVNAMTIVNGVQGGDEFFNDFISNPQKYLQSFQGKHEVSLFSGVLNYSYPLWLPKGRLGATPKMNLTYSSIDSHYSSPVGFGWSLPINAVYRTPKKGTDQIYNEDRFAADIFGNTQDLIVVDSQSGLYAPKDEGDFSEFSFNGTSWTAKDAYGNMYTFGASGDARQDDPQNSAHVFKWLLEKIEDPHGNFITYTYTKHQGVVYPDTIRYTGFGNDPGLFEVKFNLQSRDSFVSYRTGFQVSYEKLIDSIELRSYESGSPVTFLMYDFDYVKENNAIWLLQKITVKAGNESLPPTQFEYFKGIDAEVNKKINGLKKVVEPYGAIHTFTYKPSTAYREADQTSSNWIPFVVHTVLQHTHKAGPNSPAYTTTYDYRDGHYYVDDLDVYRREYAGFGKVTITDAAGNVRKIFFHQSQFDPNNTDNSAQGEFEDHISKKGKIYRDEQWDNANHLRNVSIQKWDKIQLADADNEEERHFVFLARNVLVDYGENNQSKTSAASYQYDDYGNITEHINYGEVTLNGQNGDFTDVGSDLRKALTSYVYNVPLRLLRFPSQEEYFDTSNNLVGRKKLYYDTLAFGQITKGNLTKEELFSGANSSVSMQIAYDLHGLPITVTNPRGYSTQTVYDSFFLYPQSITNAKNQSVQYQHDPKFGMPLIITDPNDGVVQYVFDNFGRVTEQKIKAPDNQLKTLQTFSYDFAASPVAVTTTLFADNHDLQSNPIEVTSKTYFDGFGRKIQEKTEAEGSQYVFSSISYDERGNVKEEFLPQFTNTLNYETPNGNDPKTSLSYDALNRPKTATNSLGTTHISYNAWGKSIIDPNGNKKDFRIDAYGNLVEVKEFLANTGYSTFYEYDVNNNLAKITDAKGNIRNFSYDFLGRKLSQEDLHTPNDSTFGTWTYQYDPNGNLASQTDPKNQTTNYSYDELDRVSTEDFAGEQGLEVKYYYDEGDYGIGRLTGVASPSVSTSFSYDILGRVIQEQKTISGQNYTTTLNYDLAGNLLSVAYPDGDVVNYGYNNAGQIKKVLQGLIGIVTNLEYAPTGAITTINYANGVSSVSTFDPQKLYRLTHKLTTIGPQKMQDISYQYDPVGNILQITDASNHNGAKTAVYEYDDVYRLTSAVITNAANSQNYTHTYSYDIIGNILSRSDAGTYEYVGGDPATSVLTASNPHAVTAITATDSVNYGYDENGNLTSDGTWTHIWDYKDRLIASVGPEETKINFSYDYTGNRVKKFNQSNGSETHYINQYFDREDTVSKKYIFVGDLKVATEASGSGIVYHHPDHLTGSNVDTNAAGEPLEVLDYFPYGNVRLDEQFATWSNDYKFTGKELDEDTGLYYYGARYYNANIGRFISQDPWGGDITDPQSFNKYSYVMNNPLKYVDPDGKQAAAPALQLPFINFSISPAQLTQAGTSAITLLSAVRVKRDYENAIRKSISLPPPSSSTIIDAPAPLPPPSPYIFPTQPPSANTTTDDSSPLIPAAGPFVFPEDSNNSLIKTCGGAIVCSVDGNTQIGGYDLSEHAKAQMAKRNITKEQIENAIKNGESFKYWGDRKGYYDKENNIFVGTGDKITTVIKPDNPDNYIENKKKETSPPN